MKTELIKKIFLFVISNALSMYGQGIIKGSIVDSLTLDQLKGAEIILTGTTFSAVSNTDGEFRMAGIPAGEYIVQASYLGYEDKKYLVDIKTEETQLLKIELLPIVTTENGMIFTQQARSQDEEINLQTRSNSIKNVMAGKKLQDLPDENIPVALSRLPGVSILNKTYEYPYYRMEGGFSSSPYTITMAMPPTNNFSFSDDPYPRVLIRGLDSKFSNITIDGTRILPTSANNKSIDLSIFSERGFQNIELNKTITSDEDGDATAGAINIVTGNAPYKRTIKAELSGNDNNFEKSVNQYNFIGSYGDRFFDNLLGVQVHANLEKKILSDEYQSYNFTGGLGTPEPINILAYRNTKRESKGANILLDFLTPDGGSIKLNNFYNRINTDYFENKLDSSFSVFSHPLLSYCDREIERKVFLSSIGGNNHLFGFDVDWNAAYSDSKTGNPYYFSLNFYFPSSYWDQFYYLDNSIDSPSKNYCKEQTASINITKNYNLSNEVTGVLKFGGKYRINYRSFDENLRGENSNLSGNFQYTKLADDSLVLKDFSGTRFDGLVGKDKSNISLSYFQDNPSSNRILFNKYKIPLINEDALHLWRQVNYSDYYLPGEFFMDQTYYKYNDGADINSYNFSESVLAGYIMHDLSFGQWAKFITGIRIESEHDNYSGYYFSKALTTAENLYNSIPQKTKTYYYNKVTLLPNFQMLLQPVDFLNVRLAAYKTLIRPDCSARIPKIFGYSAGNYLNMGNPDLKNADVWNYEIQTQFFGNDIGQFSINAFYKNIVGMVQGTNGIELSRASTVESLGLNWSSFPINFPFKNNNSYYYLYTYYNSPKPARIWGFEIEHLANFRYLPGLLKNIVLNYNFTFLRSEIWTLDVTQIATTSTEDVISYKKQKLSDMPEFLANINLGYDIKGFSFRISYFYKDVYPISDNYYLYQIRENKLSRLDIAVKQQIVKSISVFLSLNNITDTNEEALYRHLFATNWKTAQAYRNGMNLNFGVRVDL